MVKGVTAYRSTQQTLATSAMLGKTKNVVAKATKDAKKEISADLSKLLILPGAITGTYALVNLNQIKCGRGCDDFDCDFNIYTFG